MSTARCMIQETVWFDQPRIEDAEKAYQEVIAQRHSGLQVVGTKLETPSPAPSGPLSAIEQARGLIGQALSQPPTVAVSRSVAGGDLERRVAALEAENRTLRASVASLEKRVAALEGRPLASKTEAPPPKAPVTKEDDDDDDDDDFDPFASDDDEEEEDAVKQQRLKEYEEKKAKKPKKTVVAKSSLILDVKPWDDETDISEMEKLVRSVTKDGLLWGASKILPVAYGIKKLQISCVIEDDKVGTDFLEESIVAFEDLVQSVDIVAFNKI